MAPDSTPEFNRSAAFYNYIAFRHEYHDREDFVRALNTVFGADGIIVQTYARPGPEVSFEDCPLWGGELVEFYRDMDTHSRLEFESAFYEFMEEGFPAVAAAIAENPSRSIAARYLARDLAALKVAIADGPAAAGHFPDRRRAETKFLEAHLLGNSNTVPPAQPELKW
jgi:hypothetical protein